MSFIDNLRKKMAIDKMAAAVITSLRPPGSERHVDRENMIALLEMAGYQRLRRRDNDLYVPDGDATRHEVLVLDNDLPLYHTSVEDVEMRKSPTVKEMVNLRNIRKILVDTDVVTSRQADTVRRVQETCLADLNLDWKPADIHEIAAIGARSLENGYTEGVTDALALFSEILGFTAPPKALQVPHHDITGQTGRIGDAPVAFGPLVAFSRIDNALRLVDSTVRLNDATQREEAVAAMTGKSDPAAQGRAVFDWLENRVLS
ncbi:MAG: hypothetical protein ABIL58_20775 [Pseudomonadota bacterium]